MHFRPPKSYFHAGRSPTYEIILASVAIIPILLRVEMHFDQPKEVNGCFLPNAAGINRAFLDKIFALEQERDEHMKV